MVKQGKKIIHVEILSDEYHHYFGSLKAIFKVFTSADLGITYGSLKNFKVTKDNPYRNAKCIIRSGLLVTIESGRGKYERTSNS